MISREKEEEMLDLATNYMALYGVNVNMARAIPFIKDGLKPIHRRILFALYKFHGDSLVRTSVLMGDVGKLSPHGDLSLNATIAKMCQKFSNNVTYLDGHGNTGNVTTGDDFAADRYYSVKMSKFSKEVFFGEFDGKINMMPSYDGSFEEPFTLPAKFPTVLLNGTSGIGYTLSSDLPPYNLNEVADATIKIINFDKEFRKVANAYTKKHRNEVSEYLSYAPNVYNVMTVKDSVFKELGLKKPKIRLIPDSPTGCNVFIRDADKYTMESVYEIDNVNYTITIYNTPYLVYIDDLDKSLRTLQESPNAIPEIIAAEEESKNIKEGMKYVIHCKPCNVQNVVNKLFKKIGGFRSNFITTNMTVIDSTYHTKLFNVGQILGDWISQRFEDKRAWLLRDLVAKTTRLNMLEGKAYMLSGKNLERTVNVFKNSRNKLNTIENLVKEYKGRVTSSQAAFIAELKMYHITQEEHANTLAEIKKVEEDIEFIKNAVNNDDAVQDLIISDLMDIKKNYGEPRRSKIISPNNDEASAVGTVHILPDGNVIFAATDNLEALSSDIKPINGNMVCLIDNNGYGVWVDTRKVQHNVSLPLIALGNKKMDKCIASISNVDNLLILLTNYGRIKGVTIRSLISNHGVSKIVMPLDPGETLVSALEVPNNSDDILIYTKDGKGKRIAIKDISIIKSTYAGTSLGRTIVKDPSIDNISGMFVLNSKKPLICYVTNLGRMRINHAKYLVTGKKYDDLKPLIELCSLDDLQNVFCCDDHQIVTLYTDNGKSVSIPISTLGISTINTPPVKAKGLSGRVKIIRSSIT